MPRELTSTAMEEFRERLCAVAETLFADHGAAKVSIRQIADAMGVSAMTPYRYFKDKGEIVAAVRARGFDRFTMQLENAYKNAEKGAHGKAIAVRNAYLDHAFDNQNSYKLMFDFHQADEGDYPDLVAAVARARITMTAFVYDLIEEGLVTGEAQQLGELIWSATHGAVVLEMARKLPAGSARSLASQFERLLLNTAYSDL